MSIEEILEAMDIELDKSKNVPLTRGKSLIDVEQFRDLIGQVRLNLPGEIKQAQALVNDRRVIINDAKAEAESIIRKAEEKAKAMVSEEVITKQAQNRAHEILTSAQTKSKEIKSATNKYVESMLSRVDELLTSNLTDVRKTRASLKDSQHLIYYRSFRLRINLNPHQTPLPTSKHNLNLPIPLNRLPPPHKK